MTALTAPPEEPTTDDPSTFADRADALIAWYPTHIAELIAFQAALTSIAAGTAFSIPYTFSTTTTDADPGAGYLRLDNVTQNAATTIRADLTGADGSTWTNLLDTFDDSTSTVKGQLFLVKLGDATKWLAFNVTALASPSGYRNITVTNVASSAASPFVNGDFIALKFTRTGDKGVSGDGGLSLPIATYTVGSAVANIDFLTAFTSTYDNYLIVGNNISSSAIDSLRLRLAVAGSAEASNYGYLAHSSKTSSTSWSPTASSSATAILLSSDTHDPAQFGSVVIQIRNVNSSNRKDVFSKVNYKESSAGNLTACHSHGEYTGSGIVSGFRLFWGSGSNFDSGTFKIYGLAK